MGYLADEIENAALQLDIMLPKLNITEIELIRSKLAYSFSKDPDLPWSLSHQNLKNTQSLHDPKGWMLIQDYVQHNLVVLFVNPDDEEDMWIVPSGIALTSILSETIGYVFYVTSLEADYLLCFDDHDCLIAAGEAIKWLLECREKKERELYNSSQ